MTKKRDLKRRVRERQATTGESYVTARRHVVGEAERSEAAPVEADKPVSGPSGAIPVVEMISMTDEAQRLGMRCRVAITSVLAARANPSAVLARVRDALAATQDDPTTSLLRNAVFRGEVPHEPFRLSANRLDGLRRFIARALAGIGGISESGTILALHVDGHDGSVLVIAHLGFRTAARPWTNAMAHVPRLVLSTPESLGTDPVMLAVMPFSP